MRRLIGIVAAAGMAWNAMGQQAAAPAPDATSKATKQAGPVMIKIESRGFTMEYRADSANFVGKLSYRTAGWVSVGFNPAKKMKDADIIIGYAGTNGESVVADHFGVTPTSHKPDTAIGGQNSIVEGRCEEKDGVTTMWFTIPLVSGDAKDSKIEAGKEVPAIFAAGKKDDLASKHSAVASVILKL